MYTSKKFKVKHEEEVFHEIEQISIADNSIRKVFLADGNAMVLSSGKLLRILTRLNWSFPRLNRVSAYARSLDLENKTVEELKELKEAGLKLIYVGIETGDNELLNKINKGETAESMARNLLKAKEAGIKLSVMILTGIGGKNYSKQHAENSAKIVNKVQPEFLSTLILSFPFGVAHYLDRFGKDFEEMKMMDLLKEQYDFISQIELNNVIFRTDHVSNYLALKGILGRDKEQMLEQLKFALNNPHGGRLRDEWQRGL
jgi:radical SAM superfamily enzyme YgiQ (UPF0313 family)